MARNKNNCTFLEKKSKRIESFDLLQQRPMYLIQTKKHNNKPALLDFENRPSHQPKPAALSGEI